LLVRKYVVIVLHKIFGILFGDHNIDQARALREVCWRFVKTSLC
jgi:hypothetical protein